MNAVDVGLTILIYTTALVIIVVAVLCCLPITEWARKVIKKEKGQNHAGYRNTVSHQMQQG